MERQYVHLSSDLQVATEVGKRRGKPVIFIIDSQQAHQDGVVFHVAENGVWLTEYVNIKYVIGIINDE